MNTDRGGRKACKYYRTCGSSENCQRCQGFEKEPTNEVPETYPSRITGGL